ncbi:disulfide bond formation protein B [Helicobacter baculiformis]|uniref:Disulfide bond formation protein B n=1 Tax=Helicobacter baculiformis TaxID=427351 RepID=A0ABV7ZKQ5_9HELI|nr:disulfide bond formation protein B [Helicobacter baculiformis]
MEQSRTFYFLFSLAIIGIVSLPVGIGNLVLGFIYHDSPCIQCWAERQSMVYIGLAGLFILRYGLKPKYLAIMLLVVAGGLYQSFYHYGNHGLEDVGQGFALTIWGLHTQFWAHVVFWSVVLVLGGLLLFAPSFQVLAHEGGVYAHGARRTYRDLSKANNWAFFIVGVIAITNMVQAFISTGPFPYLGQGDPIRFSWNLKENVWSTENWKHMGFPRHLGKRIVDTPLLADSKYTWDYDYHHAPLEIHKELPLRSQKINTLALNAPISDLLFLGAPTTSTTPPSNPLAMPASSQGCAPVHKSTNYYFSPDTFAGDNALLKDTFLIGTQEEGFYVANKGLDKILTHFVLDKYYAATVENFVGVNMVGNLIRVMGQNKSSADVHYNPKATNNFANFLQGANNFEELGRNRLRTSRASTYYVLSARSDGTYTYMLTVPNARYKNLILVSMLDQDLGLNAEHVVQVTKNNPLKPKRNLSEFYITGLTLYQGKLLALSKAFNTLLVIDPMSAQILDAYGLPSQIHNASALAIVDDALVVVGYEKGQNIFYTLDLAAFTPNLTPIINQSSQAPELHSQGC